MVNWQVTVTTIYCNAVEDEVTLMVYKDGSIKCVGYKLYHTPGKETRRMLKAKGKELGRNLVCEGPECHRAIQYRDKLLAEEAKETGSPSTG